MTILALTDHNGIRLGELGFLLAAIAGAVLALGAIAPFGGRRAATFLGGLLLAAGAILLIVATHWGHFG